MTSTNQIVKLKPTAFKRFITGEAKEGEEVEKPAYGKLERIRSFLYKNLKDLSESESEEDQKLYKRWYKYLLIVENEMKARVEEGVQSQRRKPGTGKKVTETRVYKDTLTNRKKNRVGQTYSVTRYENFEVETQPRRFRRRTQAFKTLRQKRHGKSNDEENSSGSGRRNLWIESVLEAKTALNAPKFVIIRREAKDPNDEKQQLGVQVYQKAVEIMAQKKAAEAAEAQAQETAQPMEVSA